MLSLCFASGLKLTCTYFCSLLSVAHNPVALGLNLNVLIQNANNSNKMGNHMRRSDASKVDEY